MKKNIKKNGFTLIELMIVVVILAVLATAIVPRLMSRPEQARKVKAETDIISIQNAMDLYKLDNGFYPSMQQNIEALVHQPDTEPRPENWQSEGYLKSVPKDPWGQEYHYRNPGEHGLIDIWSEHLVNKKKIMISNWGIDA